MAHSTASSAQRLETSRNAATDVAAGAGTSDRIDAEDSGHSSSRDRSDRRAGDGQADDDGSWQRQSAASRLLLPSGREAEASLAVLSSERQQLPGVVGSRGSVVGAAEKQRTADAAADGGAAAPRRLPRTDELNHDTIAMVAIDAKGRIAAGASSNGANHKVRWSEIAA